MRPTEQTHFYHHRGLNLNVLQAFQAGRGYPRHSHDYTVIALVDSGVQSFELRGSTYVTTAGGLILLNPGETHTGEPRGDGYRYRAFYPTTAHLDAIAEEFGWRYTPHFTTPRADDPALARQMHAMFNALTAAEPTPEAESRYLAVMLALVRRYGGQPNISTPRGTAHQAVQRAIDYIHAHAAEPVSLAQLAEVATLSRYHLLRVFSAAVGMPPHRYLESVRIRHAQRLLAVGVPLAEIAYRVGFASQSHFTQRFRHTIGVTPGVYARQISA